MELPPWQTCPLCPYKYRLKGVQFLRHMNRTHVMKYSGKPFNCTNEPEELKCKVCGSSFDCGLSLKEHSEQVHSNNAVQSSLFDRFGAYQCRHCKGFTNSMLSYDALLYCCERKEDWHFKPGLVNFLNTDTIHTHNIQTNQSSGNGKLYKCQHCSYKIKYNSDLHKHIVYRNTGDEAPKMFQHTSKEPKLLKCNWCSRKLKSKQDLESHMLHKHTSEDAINWARCERCSFKCKTKRGLKRHMLNKHTNPEDIKWYHCNGVCSYKAKRKEHLKAHMRSKHANEGTIVWFRCEICSYKCKYKGSVKQHMRNKHTKVEDIQWLRCEHCPHKCKRKSQMQTHVLYKHTDKDAIEWFQCGHCSHKCVRKWNLKQHILHKHTNREKP